MILFHVVMIDNLYTGKYLFLIKKIEDETQLLFNGHDLSIDCIKSFN